MLLNEIKQTTIQGKKNYGFLFHLENVTSVGYSEF